MFKHLLLLALFLALLPHHTSGRGMSRRPKPSLELLSVTAESIGVYSALLPTVTRDSVRTHVTTNALLDGVLKGNPAKQLV